MDEVPQKIGVLGAGPIGLEAALYARFLGYEVTIFERGEVAESVQQWGHVRMFSPFSINSSPLGLAALEGQDASYVPPRPDALLRGSEWREEYLLPLAQSDLLVDSIRTQTTVIAIGRSECRKHDTPDPDARVERPFRILTRRTGSPATADNEQFHTFDIVIDTTGTYGNSNGLGPDGTPARGESAMKNRLAHNIPNHGTDASALQGKRLLVIGCGYSAATTLVELSKIVEANRDTHVTWLVRRPASDEAPLRRIADDRLAARDLLADQINQWAVAPPSWLTYHPRCWVESLVETPSGKVAVHWEGDSSSTEEFDHVIANVGFRPDRDASS
jgi:thioredoxin reductase